MVNTDDAERIHERINEAVGTLLNIKALLEGDGSDGKPGILIRLDRIEQLNKHRRFNVALSIGAIATAAATLVGELALHIFVGK